MGGSTCLICQSTWKNKNVSMFTVPKNESLRQSWNRACERRLRENGRVCEQHFRKEDIVQHEGSMKKKRLKKNSIPSLFLKRQNERTYYAGVTAKDKLNKNYESTELLYEDDNCEEEYYNIERLDETTVELGEPEDANRNIAKKPSPPNAQETSPLERRTCGLLQVYVENEFYTITCFDCSEEFPLWCWTKFIEHLRDEHQLSKKENSHESEVVQQKDSPPLVQNRDEDIRDAPVDCDVCGNSFPNEQHLQAHQSSDHAVANFPNECSRCDWRYASVEQLNHHELDHIKEERHICGKCNSGFLNRTQLMEHMAVHKTCVICHKVLNSRFYYRKHMVLHYPPQYECDICRKKYHYLERLKEHEKEHFS